MSHDWLDLVQRLHSDIMCERMLMMKRILLSDIDRLTPIQRKLLASICSFIGPVYNNAYTQDHFDIIYQDKVLKINSMDVPWSTTDFDTLTSLWSISGCFSNHFAERGISLIVTTLLISLLDCPIQLTLTHYSATCSPIYL